MTLGYQDYVASRFLINNDYLIQGTTLASSSVEKYLKVLLMVLNKPVKKVHLDNLDLLKAHFAGTIQEDLFKYLDDNFLEVLGKAYKFRYYDNIKTPDSVGFFVNQFLGELDYTVGIIELLLNNMVDEKGNQWHSHYAKAFRDKSDELFKNNNHLTDQKKEDYMKKPTTGFGIYINPKNWEPIDIKTTVNVIPPYEGKITLIVGAEANRN